MTQAGARTRGTRLLALLTVLLGGCASTSAPVAWEHDKGCFVGALPATWSLVMHDMPGYFAPLMANGVSAAMRNRGLTGVAFGADVDIAMRFEMIDLGPPAPARDPLGETMMDDSRTNFLARVEVVARAADGRETWSGTLSRMHSIRGDETIHRARAALLISNAIDALFADFPVACQ